jgi:hypothetical protein
MAAISHQRARASERAAYGRRLALAAIASGLVHLLVWGGLTATRLTLLGSKPQDATATKPALKPKLVADFPLQVPKSPSVKPDHERPLDMQVMPRPPQDVPRPESVRRTPPAAAPTPEQPLPIVVTPPTLARPKAPREVAADRAVEKAAAPERQRLAAAAAPADATADRLAAAPGQDTAASMPKPSAAAPRPAERDSAAVARRRPREVAMASPALPVTSPLSSRLPAAVGDDSAPPQPPAPAPTARREIASLGDPSAAPVQPITAPAGAASTDAAATPAPRPQSSIAGLTAGQPRADRGTWAPLRSQTTAGDAPADGVGDMSATSQAVATSTAAAGRTAALTVERQGAGRSSGNAGETMSSPASGSGSGSAMAPSPLARSSPIGGSASAAGSPAGSDSTVAAIALPAAAEAGIGPAAAGGADGGTPSPQALSRLGGRTSAATYGLAASGAAESRADGDTLDGEELSSVAEAGAVVGSLTTRSRGDDAAAAIAPQPLDRVAAVTLPIEGRVREIAIPFARRSRANRDARGREQPASELAIREKTRVAADAMVDRGLEFLARAQQPDGRWRLGAFPGSTATDTPKLSCDTAATGLAILSFLGAGHDHFGGRYRDTVRRGLEFLLSVQKDDGDLYVPADKLSDSCAWLYSHGIASMALCEAVGMTGDPLVKPAAARACGFIAASQHPSRGGWRYTPRSDADLSVSGWMLVAMRSGRLAGVDVEPRAFDGVKTLLDASAIAGDPAKYHYNPRNPQQRPSQLSAGCMTAVGTLMRLHTGWTATDPRVQQSARALAAIRPTYGTAREKNRDCYLWYYASQVLVHTGGDEWTDWYDQLADTLEQTQERQGPGAGSWDPLGTVPDRWGQYGGRIYVTALHLLALEVPDRRLPTYGTPEDAIDH